MSTVSSDEAQETTPYIDRLEQAAVRLERLETLPKPYDLYYALKKDGQGTGWNFACVGIGVADIRGALNIVYRLRATVEQLHAKLTCCCGDDVNHSAMAAGHSPVSMYDHALDSAESRVKELEREIEILRAAHHVDVRFVSTSDQVTRIALSQLWDMLGVNNQTEAVLAIRALR